jgi:hypothetical protein
MSPAFGDTVMPKTTKAATPTADERAPFAVDGEAPFICFDSIPAFGAANGIFNIVLAASRPTLMADGQVPSVPMVRAQLQCSMDGLQMLRSAIEQLLLLTSIPQGQPS